jgi:hypothetical protein
MKDEVDALNWSVIDYAFGIVYDDEYLMFVAQNTSTVPNKVFAYTMKPPKQNPQQGWAVLDVMPAFSACVVGFSAQKPLLFLGSNTGGTIQEAFYGDPEDDGTSTYVEVSKKITFGSPYQEKRLVKMIFRFDSESSGTLNVYVIYENGEEVLIGGVTFSTTAVRLTQTLPFFLQTTASQEKELDLHYDSDYDMVRRSRDFRIKITSADKPVILGYIVQGLMYPFRYLDIKDTTTQTFTAASIGGTDNDTDDSVTAAALGEQQ